MGQAWNLYLDAQSYMLQRLRIQRRSCRFLQQNRIPIPEPTNLRRKKFLFVSPPKNGNTEKLTKTQWLQQAGITPSNSRTYTSSAIISALEQQHGATPVIQCSGSELDQVYYGFETKGSVPTGQFIPTDICKFYFT